MSKDQTPKADGLRAMREETRGHLQATTAPPKLIPYAGKDSRDGTPRHGGIPYSKNPKPDGPPRKRAKHKRKIT